MTKLQLKYLKPHDSMTKNGQPFSSQFDDVFFNVEDGLAESRYVFIQHNQLIERWQQDPKQASFCVAETGFGTGLNFLAVLQAWHECQQKPGKLIYISKFYVYYMYLCT